MLRRGFKAEAERLAEDLRSEMGLGSADPVPPTSIAEHLGVEVRVGDELLSRERFRELEKVQPGAFSACTFRPNPTRIVVVLNPLSSPARRNSDLAHELAHVLLDHELTRLERLGDVSFFVCDAVQEEEAAWLSGCLLIPRPLLLSLLQRRMSTSEIAKELCLSESMVTYRINVTGARRQLRSAAR
ncbi:MAG: ImmA/IrrE family metallo-endopeptidase [Chloroflexi bacterium]|nr:ImmA/IrrE family metallo-endopeptidase [Chloroflexota bacterium]